MDLDEDENFRFASLQSKVGQSLLMQNGRKNDDISSLALVTSDGAFFESEAVLRIAQELRGLPAVMRGMVRVGRNVVPRFLRDSLYHFVGDNRYIFGERDGPSCRIDFDGTLQKRFVDDPDL